MRTFRLAMLNVVMPQPHSQSRYRELLQETYRLRRIVNLRGDYAGMMGALHQEDDFLSGYFYKFFNLNKKEGWFNVARRKEAEPSDLAQIQIPDELKPHHQMIRFILFPKVHRVIFVTKDGRESLSPAMAKVLLDRLFEEKKIVQEFGEIEVTVEPCREQLKRIFSLPRIKTLSMEIMPPNPDDLDETEEEVMGRMNAERAQKMTISLATKHPKGLAPDAQHKALARIAQSNGKVVARGESDKGTVVTLSTLDHPMIEPVSYDPDTQSREDAMKQKAISMLQRMRD